MLGLYDAGSLALEMFVPDVTLSVYYTKLVTQSKEF